MGLLGGISWVSTGLYYEFLNTKSKARTDGHQVPILIKSFDYKELHAVQDSGGDVSKHLAAGAKDLESIGADVIAICANTMHEFYPQVQAAVSVPVLHVADALGKVLREKQIKKAGLLGTAYTMELPFFKDWLRTHFDIEAIAPNEADRFTVNRVIREELVWQKFLDSSRDEYRSIASRLKDGGAEALILGCTEIGLLIKPGDTVLPEFDTTVIHCDALLDFALS